MNLSKRVLELKNKISKIFLTVPNEDLYHELLTTIREEFESQFGYFGYIDLNGDLVCPSMTKDIWDRCQVHQKDFVFPREKWEKKDTIWGRSVAENKLLVSNSPRNVPKGHLPIKKILVVPITFHEEVIGQIALANKPGGYNDDDIKLIEEITDFIAPIFNVRKEKEREMNLRQNAEKSLRKSQHKLRERIKELRCLYGITQLTEKKEVSIEEVMKGTIELIPPAFQYPNLTSALISFDEKDYKTKDFTPSEFKLSSQTQVNDSYLNIEVYYKENREFLHEEEDLIKEISNKLKFIVERILSEKKLKESERKFRILNRGFLSYTDDPLKNIHKLVKTVKDILNADWAFYNKLLKKDGKSLIQCYGLDENDSEITLLEDSEGIVCTDIIQQNRKDLVIFEDIDKSSYAETDAFIREKNIKLYVGSVVKLAGNPVADICVLFKENREISEVEINIINILSQAAAIEEARLAEKENLKESQEKFKDLFNSVSDAIFIYDFEGNFLEINKTAIERLGYSREEFLEMNLFDIDHPKFHPKIVPRIKSLKENGQQLYKTEHIRKNGTAILVEVNSRIIIYNERNAVMSLARDITKRKKAEKALKESEEMFRTIVEQSMLGIAILQNNRVQYINEKCASLYGYSVKEIKNWEPKEFLKIIDPEYRDWVGQQARKKQEGSDDVINHYIFKGVRKDSERIWIEQFSKTIYYKGSTANFVIQIDITEKIQTERELRESEEKIREAYDRAEFYKDLFAHDINNILHNVKSSVELLNSMYKNNNLERFENIFEILQEQVIRGSNLVNNIRNLSEIEDAEKIIESIDLKKIVKDAIYFVKKSVDEDNLKINLHSEIDNPEVKANKLLLDVFENVLFNAIEYNQNNPKIIDIYISESISEGKDYIKIEFQDNGIGIPPELKNRLFKEKIDYERRTKGMGLGLLTVHKILTSYGGKIWVENRIKGNNEEGSNMVILLPKA
jgi:PAS domain S-box-containing protein